MMSTRAADKRRDHGDEDHRGEPASVVSDRARVLDVADQVEVGLVAERPGEFCADLQEQRVAGVQPDVADLVGQACAVAMHGHDRRVVKRAKVGVADRFADQGRARADDRLAQLSCPTARSARPRIGLSAAGTRPGIFSRSTIVLTTPVKTSRSLA